MKQEIILSRNPLEVIARIAEETGTQRFMLVCDSAFPYLGTYGEYRKLQHVAVTFSAFSPNPRYEEVCNGVNEFRSARCDGIIAIGGGSAMDTAKCIKAFSQMEDGPLYLKQAFPENHIPFIAVPTTAGTGSESTRYAVVYYKGEKQSVTDNSLIPNYALLDPRNLMTLPLYQKKCTMLDALCQGIESWWSVNATEESRVLSQKAVAMILDSKDGYLAGQEASAEHMMVAANLAGQAINITQTTAAHAMSYKLTSLYKIPHGRAAFACLPHVWDYMIRSTQAGTELAGVFESIAQALHCSSPQDAVASLKALNRELFGEAAVAVDVRDIPLLAGSVNVTRLKNNPVKLDEAALTGLYGKILAALEHP